MFMFSTDWLAVKVIMIIAKGRVRYEGRSMISLQHRLLSSVARGLQISPVLFTPYQASQPRRSFTVQDFAYKHSVGRHKVSFFVVVLAEQRSLPCPVLKCSRAAVDILKQSPVSSQHFVNNPECDILPRLCLFSSVRPRPSQFIPVRDRTESENLQQDVLRPRTVSTTLF